MFTITINLPKKVEQELEKDFKYLEGITKKPREYHIKEALIRYMLGMEWDVRKREIKKNIKEGDKIKETDKIIKEIWSRKPHDHHIVEALIRYIEDMEDIRDVEKIKEKERKIKYYTNEEADQRIKELRAKNV